MAEHDPGYNFSRDAFDRVSKVVRWAEARMGGSGHEPPPPPPPGSRHHVTVRITGPAEAMEIASGGEDRTVYPAEFVDFQAPKAGTEDEYEVGEECWAFGLGGAELEEGETYHGVIVDDYQHAALVEVTPNGSGNSACKSNCVRMPDPDTITGDEYDDEGCLIPGGWDDARYCGHVCAKSESCGNGTDECNGCIEIYQYEPDKLDTETAGCVTTVVNKAGHERFLHGCFEVFDDPCPGAAKVLKYGSWKYTRDPEDCNAPPTVTKEYIYVLGLVKLGGACPSEGGGGEGSGGDTTTLVPELEHGLARGAYDSGTLYNAGDLLTHAGASWVALQELTGVTPGTDSAYWVQRNAADVPAANHAGWLAALASWASMATKKPIKLQSSEDFSTAPGWGVNDIENWPGLTIDLNGGALYQTNAALNFPAVQSLYATTDARAHVGPALPVPGADNFLTIGLADDEVVPGEAGFLFYADNFASGQNPKQRIVYGTFTQDDPTAPFERVTLASGTVGNPFGIAVRTVTHVARAANVATITVDDDHGFAAGQIVTVLVGSSFDAQVVIASTPTPTTFTYAQPDVDVATTAASGTAAIQYTGLQWYKGGCVAEKSGGGAITAGTATLTLTGAAAMIGRVRVGGWYWLTDGPFILESRGEWVQVQAAAVSGSDLTVALVRETTLAYEADMAVLALGMKATGYTIRNGRVGTPPVSAFTQTSSIFVKGTPNALLENVHVVPHPNDATAADHSIALGGVGFGKIHNCSNMGGPLSIGGFSHDVEVQGGTFAGLTGEEGVSRVTYRDVRGYRYMRFAHCESYTFEDCYFRGMTGGGLVFIMATPCPDFQFHRCHWEQAAAGLTFQGDRLVLKDCTSTVRIDIYAGTGIVIDNLTCTELYIHAGTSGRYGHTSVEPIFDDAATRAAWAKVHTSHGDQDFDGNVFAAASVGVGTNDPTAATLNVLGPTPAKPSFRVTTLHLDESPKEDTFQGKATTADGVTAGVLPVVTVEEDGVVDVSVNVWGRRTGGSAGNDGDCASFALDLLAVRVGSGDVEIVNTEERRPAIKRDAGWGGAVPTGDGAELIVEATGANDNDVLWFIHSRVRGDFVPPGNNYAAGIACSWPMDEFEFQPRADRVNGLNLIDSGTLGQLQVRRVAGPAMGVFAAGWSQDGTQWLQLAHHRLTPFDHLTTWYLSYWFMLDELSSAITTDPLFVKLTSGGVDEVFSADVYQDKLRAVLWNGATPLIAEKAGVEASIWYHGESWHTAGDTTLWTNFNAYGAARSGSPGSVDSSTAGVVTPGTLYVGRHPPVGRLHKGAICCANLYVGGIPSSGTRDYLAAAPRRFPFTG